MEGTQIQQLADRAALGDRQAFSELARASGGTLYAAARAILRSDQDAQDCVQEAVLKGWNKLPSLRDRSLFLTWMTRITVNTAINMLRRRRPSAPLSETMPAKDERKEERLDIRRAIESLEPKARLCTVLYYFEDMPISQIAKIAGVREGTVKSRLFRARETLRQVLEGYDDGE